MTSPNTTSRRRLLQAGIVGGTAVWAAPVIESLVAPAAAASCNCTTANGINWSTTAIAGTTIPASTNGPANISGYPFNWGNFPAAGGIPVTFAYSTTTPGLASPYRLVFGGSADLTGRQPTTTNGNVTGIYGMDKQNAAVGDSVTLTITFGCNVRNLAFTLLDIDQANTGGNNYVDKITVRPFLGATPVSGTFTPVSATPTFTPTTATTGTSATYTGNATATGTSTAGNLRVAVPGPVDKITVEYISAHPSGTGTLQEVAFSNITWTC